MYPYPPNQTARLQPVRAGSTLPELLVWIAVSGLLFALALPQFTVITSRMAVDQAMQQLVSELQAARMQATATRTSVTVRRTESVYRNAAGRVIRLGTPVVFAAGSADSVTFASFGPPLASGTFTLTAGNQTRRVVVSPGGVVQSF
jgi:type II secretory pathway pseudopilin PulG